MYGRHLTDLRTRPGWVRLAILAMTLDVGGTGLAFGQSPSGTQAEPPRLSRDIQVESQDVWAATDIELKPGERAVFSATGTSRCPGQAAEFGPAGIPRGFRDLLRILPVAQGARGAVIGRVGETEVAQPF